MIPSLPVDTVTDVLARLFLASARPNGRSGSATAVGVLEAAPHSGSTRDHFALESVETCLRSAVLTKPRSVSAYLSKSGIQYVLSDEGMAEQRFALRARFGEAFLARFVAGRFFQEAVEAFQASPGVAALGRVNDAGQVLIAATERHEAENRA